VVVLDITNVLAGPFATCQLALLGARVIKAEQLQGGDLARSLGGSSELNRKLQMFLNDKYRRPAN
jgi:CoA:oxalate CoA-transferase